MSLIHKVADIFKERKGLTSCHESWEKVELKEVVIVQNGYPFKSSNFNSDKIGMPLIRIRDIVNSSTKTYFNGDYPEEYIVKKGDLLIGMDGDFNSALWNGQDALLNQRVCRLVPNEKYLNKSFLYYGIGGYLMEINRNTSSTTVKHLSSKSIGEIPFPLPPLPEQHRIVSQLDALFGHLESLKSRLEKVPALMKNFRQAVLTQAVTGKLTEEWRVGKELGEWEEKALKDVCSGFKYGSSAKSNNSGKIPVLRMGNIQNGEVDWTDLKYSSNSDEIKKYELLEGDLLFNRTNSPDLVGKTAIFRKEKRAIYAGYLIKITPLPILKSEYLNFCMNSVYAKHWCNEVKTDGVSQSNINAQKLKNFTIGIPPKEEQTQIVHRVESLFAKADAIEQRYAALKQQIDSLPQALLAKAFRGELTEQLPTDGHAADLLKEIAALRAEAAPAKGRKKK